MTPSMVGDLMKQMLHAADEGTRWAYRMLWDIFMSLLTEYWLIVLILLVVIFLVAFAKALSGRWGMLGSVLYHYLFFGVLFIIGLVKGPEVFVSEYFEIFSEIILYYICYKSTGVILDKLGVR